MTTIIGAVVLVVTVVAYLLAVARLRRDEGPDPALRLAPIDDVPRDPEEGVPWWWGYARDAVNLGGALLHTVAFVLAGYAGPAALLLGLTLELVENGSDWLLGKQLGWRGSSWLLAPLFAATGIAIILTRHDVAPALGAILSAARPR